MTLDPRLQRIVTAQPYPLLFAALSGAHLYGFPSPDSDFDLRGAHVLPVEKVLGLEVHDETVQDSRVIEGLEMDIVSHDARKFFGLLLRKNGYVLEQLYSPLIVQTTPEHAELKAICNPHPQSLSRPGGAGGQGVITRHHAHHYAELQAARERSGLPDLPSNEARAALNDLLLRVRTRGMGRAT